MDAREEMKQFLTSRRAKVSPEQAGLPNFGGTRRVPGLRREEVALLAGVSVDYYTRLERGNAGGVSEGVLESLARALQLDRAEREHLFDLARAARPAIAPRRRPVRKALRPSVQRVLDALDVPAYVGNGRHDVLGMNRLGRALFGHLVDQTEPTPNHARFTFLDPRAREFWPEWERIADQTVAMLRTEAGRDPYDRELTDLIGQLSTRSEDFRTRWAKHNVRIHDTGEKEFHHPVVGRMTLSYDSLELTADSGLVMFVYTAEVGSRSAEALQLLSSWTATLEAEAEAAASPAPAADASGDA